MCESSVYLKKGRDERLVVGEATLIRPEPGRVHVEDILGRSQEIPGHIELVDLMNHRIVITTE